MVWSNCAHAKYRSVLHEKYLNARKSPMNAVSCIFLRDDNYFPIFLISLFTSLSIHKLTRGNRQFCATIMRNGDSSFILNIFQDDRYHFIDSANHEHYSHVTIIAPKCHILKSDILSIGQLQRQPFI